MDVQADPNFPAPGRIAGQPEAKIEWGYGNGNAVPIIHLIFNGRTNAVSSSYFGYNADGSFVKNPNDGSIYVWNLNSNTLVKRYGNITEMPQDVRLSLRNPQREYLARHSNKDGPPQAPPAPSKPDNKSRALLGDPTSALNAVKASAGSTTAVPGSGFNGTGAKVQSGMLTFTATGGANASYKVVRPKVMAENPQAATDITGSWISMEDGDKAILFTIQTDGSVTGKEMPIAVMQMLLH